MHSDSNSNRAQLDLRPRSNAGLARVRLKVWVAACAAALSLCGAGHALAVEYRVIATNGTIMYDGPSDRARKLFVATANYPVEVIQRDGGWARVRDYSGDLSWVENKSLSEKRSVIVLPASISVRNKPDDAAQVSFQAQQGVVLDLVDANAPGWLQVRHRDGAVGFVRLREVWGY